MRIANQEYDVVPVSLLNNHPENPRLGDVNIIRESISVNSFYGACLVQRETNRILAGNHRYLAALQEGAEEIPVIWIDCDDITADRIMTADNGTSDKAGYDNVKLLALLTRFNETDDGLKGTGFDEEALSSLLAAIDPTEDEPAPNADIPIPDSVLKVIVEVRNGAKLIDATQAIANLVNEHPEWNGIVKA